MERQIHDVTGVPLRRIVQAAYNLSRPQGMGFLAPHREPLTDEEADELIELLTTKRGTTLLRLDYVKGRSVKLSVYRHVPGVASQDGLPEQYLEFPWYDHHAHQERALLKKIGVEASA